MLTDAIADMLTRIRNGQKSKLVYISLPHSKMKCSILEVLKREGFIKNFDITTEKKISNIIIELKYSPDGKSVISEIHRVSKPGRRVYSSIDNLGSYHNDMGISIITTPKGVMSNKEARRHNVGGEVICQVY